MRQTSCPPRSPRRTCQPVTIGLIIQTRCLRDALLSSLAQNPRFIVADLGPGGPPSFERASHLHPDILLLDVSAGIRVSSVRSLLQTSGDAALIVLGIEDEAREALPLLEAGARGYVGRDQSLQDLIGVIERVLVGELPCSPQVAAQMSACLAKIVSGRETDSASAALTAREAQIIGLIEQGLTNKEIATRLSIEPTTVKTHVHNLMEKLAVHGRGKAAARVRRESPNLKLLQAEDA